MLLVRRNKKSLYVKNGTQAFIVRKLIECASMRFI